MMLVDLDHGPFWMGREMDAGAARFTSYLTADQIIPYTWRPFGSGNRVCIGQRFALMEIKIFISKLLYKFKVERTPRTELKYSPGGFFIISYPEIRVALHPRN